MNTASHLTLTVWRSVKEPVGACSSQTLEEILGWIRHPKIADNKLALPGFALASFEGNRRSLADVRSVCAVLLDDDSGERDVEATAAIWSGFAGVVYSTHSSTPEAPRSRTILFTSRAMTASEYTSVWSVLCEWARGQGVKLDEGTKDPSRLWFVPAVRTNATFTYAELGGDVLDVDSILAACPEPVEPPRAVSRDGASAQTSDETEPTWLSAVLQERREHDAAMYLARIPKEGDGDGSKQLVRLAAVVVRGFGCGIEPAVRIIGASPIGDAWTDSEIRRRCVDAQRSRKRELGSMYKPNELQQWLSESQAASSAPPIERTLIQLGPDLARVVEAGANALGNDPDLFKRAGELVRIVKVDASRADDAHREGTPQIRPVPPASLKVTLTRVARWINAKGNEVTPDDEIVAPIMQAGEWSRVSRLEAVCETPTMRADGSILQTPGYDRASAFFYDPGAVQFPSVLDHPTQADAHAALCDLFEPFSEFPYASGPAGMVPVAAVLTLLARPAIRGNVPAFVFEASTRGSGKTLLGDVVATIATGRIASKMTFPSGDDELEKILGGYARRGAALFSFDNVGPNNPFGGAPLDKVLTSGGSVDLRILGKTHVPTFEWRAVVMATGNNVAFRGDTPRRVLVCRLESMLENPEDRDGFRHPNLLEWVAQERARLVVAGLTLMRAYVAAGRPSVDVKPWGSFDAWSALIPRAIVWAAGETGLDPQQARPTADESAEPEKTLLERLLISFPPGDWRVRELLDGREGDPLANAPVRDVIEEIAPEHERNRADVLGKQLRAWKGRVVGGRRLVTRQDRMRKVATWRVEPV